MNRMLITSKTVNLTIETEQFTDEQADQLIEILEKALKGVQFTMRKAFIKLDVDSARTTIN